MSDTILEVKNLKTYFYTEEGVVPAVDGLDFTLRDGETLAIVGESGCGKSVTSLSILRLIKDPPGRIIDGEILYRGEDLCKLPEKRLRQIRGDEISMIFQEPMTALDPMYTIEAQIAEALSFHTAMTKGEMHDAALEMLRKVKIPRPDQILKDYPHHLSGGMLQRVMIAIALINNPRLLIADEPTTALDVTIQAQILELMQELRKKLGMSIIMITHDLGVVASMCERIAVMYAGHIVEYGTTDEIFYEPSHEYTKGLINSIPKLTTEESERLVPIEGQPVDLLNPPEGCPFAPRCENCMKICLSKMPPRTQLSDTHYSHCWLRQKEAFEAKKEGGKAV